MRYDPSFISRSQLEDGLERIWSRGGWLSLAVKKPIPHESFAQNAGYFFYYGYYYAARCLEEVAPGHLARHAAHLASDLLPMQEEDGSWWDYPRTITTNSTAPDMPYMPSPASENPCIPLMRQQLHDPCSAR